MVSSQDCKRIDQYLYEIPRSYREDMRVPAHFYADPVLLEGVLGDKSLEQLVNTTTLPGLVGYALAMPDIHQGYGFPIGAVVASRTEDGVISPGAVGFDINCGVRVLASQIHVDEIRPHLSDLASALYQNCPSGVGKGGGLKLNDKAFDKLLRRGTEWALEEGYADRQDVQRTEEFGRLKVADPAQVSKHAKIGRASCRERV